MLDGNINQNVHIVSRMKSLLQQTNFKNIERNNSVIFSSQRHMISFIEDIRQELVITFGILKETGIDYDYNIATFIDDDLGKIENALLTLDSNDNDVNIAIIAHLRSIAREVMYKVNLGASLGV